MLIRERNYKLLNSERIMKKPVKPNRKDYWAGDSVENDKERYMFGLKQYADKAEKYIEYLEQVSGVETSAEQALNLAVVSASFLEHLERQLKYHQDKEQSKAEMKSYEQAMYHRDRGGAIEDLIIHIKNAR